MSNWSNLAKIVYKRTYARKDNGILENWDQTIERVIQGNIKGHNVPEKEIQDLLRLAKERKALPAGRGLWYSGSPYNERVGGAALNNCWFLDSSEWNNFIIGQDLLMLGGGVGLSVENKFISKLPKVKKDVKIVHELTKDADLIVPDSREGWCELTRRVLESFFVTGKSFCYSTICIRGYGELIKGFGGEASGPLPLIKFIENLNKIFKNREGKYLRPIDGGDIICAIGEMVVSGNVRRSAIILLGDSWDKEYLKAKRWDLGQLPTYRSCANYSVVCDDIEDLHPLFWKTYEHGEPFGLINRNNIQKYGRMGELKKDTAYGINPCITGDSLVYVADGRGFVSIKKLSEEKKDVPVFCRDNNGNATIRLMRNPRITGFKEPIIKITLENGHVFKCTKNHKLLKNDKTYVEAQSLKIGDGLHILTRFEASFKEIFPKCNSKTQDYFWVNTGKTVNCCEHRLISEFFYDSKIPKGHVVHHKDFNGRNNDPNNLKIMSKKDHDKLHSEHMFGDLNPMRRAKTEWSEEKWNQYRKKQKINNTGEDNGNYSGISNNELYQYALKLTQQLKRRFSTKEWYVFANENNLPTNFSEFRMKSFGTLKTLSKRVALELGYDNIDCDPRMVRNYLNLLQQGYDCEIKNNEIVVIKKCEICNKYFKLLANRREQSVCSQHCGLILSNKNHPEYKLIRKKSLLKCNKKKQKNLRKQQKEVYLNLYKKKKFISKKEWINACKEVGISFEISRISSPFRYWKELKKSALNFNHKIIAIEECESEDVYNGTVDEFHNFYFGGFLEKTKSNKNKYICINNQQCGEACLESGEACNLQELSLMNLENIEEFEYAARLMHRYGKRVTLSKYHHQISNDVIKKNRRVGTGITGCLGSKLFTPENLDRVYNAIQEENVKYSKELGINESIRTTVIKPSGTISKVMDQCGYEGLHAAFSRYMIQRIRFASNDPLIPLLRKSGHKIEPIINFDDTLNPNTLVVDFYINAPNEFPVADEDWDTWKQLDVLKMVQKYWTDQSASVTIYYQKEEIPQLKIWLNDNFKYLKTISFLCHNEHGFKQAPKEKITKEQYEKLSSKIKNINVDEIKIGNELESLECQSGVCPIK